MSRILAHYEILEKIGEGGMGEVYRARDTRLHREVAVKLLPRVFTEDPERLARFEREAQVLASLNHPNVAAIHGLEESDGERFLAMELVPGEDLAHRLERGPVPVEEALDIARQLAEGLEAAHELGVVHRDLKPANVKVTPEGKVKVLDFGLAKAYVDDLGSDSSSLTLTESPTITGHLTAHNVLLGTAAYMSPEQARGKKVDKRADIWAFGAVVFELLTGKRLFEGETISDTMAAVLRADIAWDALPANTPPGLRRMLERCLERDPRNRLRDIGEARILLSGSMDDAESAVLAGGESGSRRNRERMVWGALVVILAAAALVPALHPDRPPADSGLPSRFAFVPVPGLELPDELSSPVVLSPDGSTMAIVAGSGRDRRLLVRRIDELEARELPGTAGASQPMFSPDGEWIAFFTPSKLRRVSISGGAPLDICNAIGDQARGGTWGPDGSIVFAPAYSAGLLRVSYEGGRVDTLTVRVAARQERSHRWPCFLPDGRGVVFLNQHHGENYDDGDIEVVFLDSRERVVLHRGGAFPRALGSGHLAFVREQTLFAAPLDPSGRRLLASPRPVLNPVWGRTGDEANGDGSAQFDVSGNGTLVYRAGMLEDPMLEMVWVDREGRATPAGAPEAAYFAPSISPDGRRLAVVIDSEGASKLWILDPASGALTRLANTIQSVESCVWNSESSRLYFDDTAPDSAGAAYVVHSVSVDGAEESEVLKVRNMMNVATWGSGRELIFSQYDPETNWDLFAVQVPEDGPASPESIRPVVRTAGQDGGARASSDGRWLAFSSTETGTYEVYVCSLQNPRTRWRVSNSGGRFPLWSFDGSTLYYRNGEAVMAVDVETDPTFRSAAPRELFRGSFALRANQRMWDVAPDGRFLMFRGQGGSRIRNEFVVCVNWFRELRDRLGSGGGS